MTEITFEKLRLIDPILKSLTDNGYNIPTQIQAEAIPIALAGNDLLAVAPTGTGKTAAFAIPIIQALAGKVGNQKVRDIKALILTPTRELAIQIEESCKEYGKYTQIRSLAIFGGVSQRPQEDNLRRGVDILIATPGRLLDLITQKKLSLAYLDVLVLDEADRMLDMGFIHDVKRVVKAVPDKRQTLFFSATMPTEIVKLTESILTKPVRIEVQAKTNRTELIKQQVYFVTKNDKRDMLKYLLNNNPITSAIVFSRTKYGADKLSKELAKWDIKADALHGDKSQNARQNALAAFKSGAVKILVATDIAARGIDVDDVSHVINFDIPNEPETYVHRIGRTGRAGSTGIAISLCDEEEVAYLKDIQILMGKSIDVVKEHPYLAAHNLQTIFKKVPPGQRAKPGGKPDMRNGKRPKPAEANHGGRRDISEPEARKPRQETGAAPRREERSSDRPAYRSTERSSDRPASRSGERSSSPSRSGERSSDRSPRTGGDRNASASRSNDRGPRSNDRPSANRSSDSRGSDNRSSEKPAEGSSEGRKQIKLNDRGLIENKKKKIWKR